MPHRWSHLPRAATGGASGPDERGATAVEYGLLISGIAAVIASVVLFFGGHVADLYQDTCDHLASQQSSGSC